MKLQKIVVPILALALVTGSFVFATTPAQAASSYNGLINSGGRSAVSYSSGQQYRNTYRFQNRYYDDREEFIRSFIEYLEDMIEALQEQLDDDDYDDDSDVSVTTLSATSIDDDSATLRARVDTGNEDEVTVYFEYGESSSDLDKETAHRVIEDPDGRYTYTTRLTNLDTDEKYYFCAVAEDENGDEDRGLTYSFRTDDEGDNEDDYEYPDLDTRDAEDITDDSAELRGRVDMNDFNNGRVFFVYGEDEDQIEDVADDYDTYSDVDEDGDDLQKISVDNDLDGTDSYTEDIDGLDDNTRIYYSICVEFEDEDDDDMILCGGVERFTTDD